MAESLISTIAALALGAAVGWMIPMKWSTTMKWETEQITQPPVRKSITHGPIMLSVSANDSSHGAWWKYLSMTFGKFSDQSLAQCLDAWPREAIALAREALDKLEATLREERQDEADSEGRSSDSGTECA
jgi:hypothetical protein